MRRPAILAQLLAIGASFALGASQAHSAPTPAGTQHIARQSALGVDVALRYQLHRADHPGGEDDPGPYLGDGLVAILAGPSRIKTVFPLATLDALPPNFPQIFPTDADSGCGASGPTAIENLSGAKYPAVVVTTVVIVKGCLPLAHVFVPESSTSARYVPVASYQVTHPARVFLGLRPIPLYPDATLRVARVRSIQLPNAPASAAFSVHNWTIAIVDGTDGTGRPVTIALDRAAADELPNVAETLSIFNAKSAGLLATVRLSAAHERRYQGIHPPGAPLPTPPPPPPPPLPTPTPTPGPVLTPAPNLTAGPALGRANLVYGFCEAQPETLFTCCPSQVRRFTPWV
jgi:hypothetical protein